MDNQKPNEPSPEVRQRIVDDIMKKVVDKEPKPDRDSAELEQLLKLKTLAKDAVYKKVVPIVEAAKMRRQLDPLSIHSDKGRTFLFMTIQRLYLDELRSLNREEVIFLLSLAYAEFTLNEFV